MQISDKLPAFTKQFARKIGQKVIDFAEERGLFQYLSNQLINIVALS